MAAQTALQLTSRCTSLASPLVSLTLPELALHGGDAAAAAAAAHAPRRRAHALAGNSASAMQPSSPARCLAAGLHIPLLRLKEPLACGPQHGLIAIAGCSHGVQCGAADKYRA